MSEDRYFRIRVGDEAEFLHTISAQDVESFVQLTGDTNPLHVDAEFAAGTAFGKPVVHGMLTASFISTMVGTKLPGPGAVWYEQQIRFLAPVRIGERIRVWAKVKQKSDSQRVLVLETAVFGEGGRKVIDGEAKVMVVQAEEKKAVMSVNAGVGAVIVSGASRGIGAAIARELGSAGFPVVVNYLQGQEAADTVVRGIRAGGGRAVASRANVTDVAAVQSMVAQAVAEFGSITGIVNNAAPTITPCEFGELEWDEFERHIDVQLKGAFYLTRAALPHLLARQSGVVVNIASIFVDNVPPAKLTPYNVVKAALIEFSKSLAVEYGPKTIRVNCVSPGMTRTDLIAYVPEKTQTITRMQTPLRRLATPEDVAAAVGFLFSDKAAHITGQNLRVCGGIVMA